MRNLNEIFKAYNKTLFSYRYDKYGNWTRSYEKGKRYSRCKIRYY